MNNDIKTYLQIILQNYISTFKDTSLDDNGNTKKQYLCQDISKQVYNFDKYVEDNTIQGENLPASPDAIYLGDNKFYFVEFKNQPLRNIEQDNIKNKFQSGTDILNNLLSQYISQNNIKFIFCVVYSKEKTEAPYFNPIFIESNIIRFGLDELNKKLGGFYNNIITQDVEYYKNNFKALQC